MADTGDEGVYEEGRSDRGTRQHVSLWNEDKAPRRGRQSGEGHEVPYELAGVREKTWTGL